ncbi:MAG: DUF86 domain-containing protein [Acidobacteriaceae bacterium]|nr:DUF86 domain-containing protein [Acidobacteriaceae bacterium]
MPFRNPDSALRDIINAADLIEQFTRDMDFEAFRADPKTIAAVERKLQIISEAAIRLGPEAERRCPEQPWADIRGFGNWLRHQYERVELDTIWKTIRNDLQPLKTSVQRALHPSQ